VGFETEVRVNRRIRAREVRVIGSEGNQVGVIRLDEALRLAEEEGLDLVEVSPNTVPPVCRIMDYGKFKYERKKKLQESRKKQAVIQMKELKIRPKIDEHDLQIKLKYLKSFLEDGDKVKITMMFRGREIALGQAGMKIMKDIVAQVSEFAVAEKEPKFEGRNVVMVLLPKAAGK
jgi:translation initiation factor IF-3